MKYPATCIQKILLISTRQIGDALLTTPLIHSLRCAYPQARLEVLTFTGKGAVLRGNPDIDGLLSIAERPRFVEHWRLLRQLWRRYDLAVSTQASDRPWLYSLIAAPRRCAVVPLPRPQHRWKRRFLHTWTELDDVNTPTVIQMLRLADALEIPRHYRVVPPQPDDPQTLSKQLPFPLSSRFAVVHLKPFLRYKEWPAEHWLELLTWLIRERGLPVVLTGGAEAEESRYIAQIAQKLPQTVVNLAGKLSFGEVAQLIQAAQVFIGPDTAVTHLAAATGTPTIALFGPTNPVKWAPWPADYARDQAPFQRIGACQRVGNVTLLQGVKDCVPCHQEGCERHRLSHSQCLDELSVARVQAALSRLGI